MDTGIRFNGIPVIPSFAVERGKMLQDDNGSPLDTYVVMHPYDIVQALGETGEINKAFAALEGFLRREIDMKAQVAIEKLNWMHLTDFELTGMLTA